MNWYFLCIIIGIILGILIYAALDAILNYAYN